MRWVIPRVILGVDWNFHLSWKSVAQQSSMVIRAKNSDVDYPPQIHQTGAERVSAICRTPPSPPTYIKRYESL